MGSVKKSPITAVMNGAGSRGDYAYGDYAIKNPKRINFVAVAEPDEFRRKQFQSKHNIPDEMAFDSWDKLLSEKNRRLADVAFICTPDLIHYKPAIRALQLNYHLVLEKPIAPTLEQCLEIEKIANERNRFVQVCHVMRYDEFWKKVKDIINSGRLGKIIQYEHSENVSHWHYAHSYVRGIFNNTNRAAPYVLAKTCHDLDMIQWLLGEKAVDVRATGGLDFYTKRNAPKGAPKRCLDGCPHEKLCPWFAPRLYINAEPILQIGRFLENPILRSFVKLFLKSPKTLRIFSYLIHSLKNFTNWQYWPATFLSNDLTVEGKIKALQQGPYGKCVFHSDNNQPDHIICTYTFKDGKIATMISEGIADLEGREIRIFGTKATLRGYSRHYGAKLWITDLRHTKKTLLYKSGVALEGHGGADTGMMEAFTSFMLAEKTPEEAGYSDISDAMESHYMGFAAEDARLNKKIIPIKKYRL